jgi:hypothetical protein
MAAYLRTTPINTPETPYGIKLSSLVNVADFTSDPQNTNGKSDKMDKLFAAFGGNYVALDLTGCAGTEIPDMTGTPTGPVRKEGDKLVALKLPSGLRKLGSNAFGNCRSLVSVVVPEGLETINGFYGCTSLLSITLPESVRTVGYNAFNGCNSLVSAELPEHMETIGNGAFADCVSLQSVTMPKTLNELGSSSFQECAALTSIAVPEGVTTIQWGAFYNCTSLDSLHLPASLAKIETFCGTNAPPLYGLVNVTFTVAPGNTLFEARENGKLLVYVGPTYEMYETRGFAWDDSSDRMPTNTIVAAPSLGGSVTLSGYRAVQANAFGGNTRITAVKFGEGLETLGYNVFHGCANLTSVDYPSTITYTRDIVSTVNKCPKLESLYFRFGGVLAYNMTFPQPDTVPNLTVYVPANQLQSYITDDVWAGGIYKGEPRGPYWGKYDIQAIPAL